MRPNYWLEFSHLLPKKWGRIGYPIPIPGGFVFIVTVPIGGRMRYVINRYHANTQTFTPATNLLGKAIILNNSTDARSVLAEVAHNIETEAD